MAIKAKNTITLVRTDDGLPAYVHNAWANSPDGTVDFTTVYPGENYVLNTVGGFRATGNGSSNQYPSTINNLPFNPDILGKEATIQYKLTISNYETGNFVDLKLANAVGVWSSFGGNTKISGNGTWVIQWKGTLPPLRENGVSKVDFNTNLKADILIEELQIKEGLEYQIYTPSPSEDPIGAYMKYVGTCSNHSETAPTDPSEYEWAKIGTSPTGITESTTIPTDPYVGMLWKNTGANTGYLSDVTYRWNGSRWDIYTFTAENISASTLSAICANLGTVTAGTINGVNINGSIIKNTFKNWETGIEFGSAGSGLYLGGTTTIQDGRVEIESKLHNKSGVQISPLKMFKSSISDEGIKCGTYDNSGAKTLIQLMAGELSVVDLTGSAPRYAFLNVDDIIKLKNFNEKTRVIFDAGNYGAMQYPTASNKHALGDASKIRWIIINWEMYDPSAGTFSGLSQQSVIEYSSTSARVVYDFVLPYSANGGNTAIEMTSKRIIFPYENNVTYLQGTEMNKGNYSKWWLMRKLIVVEG